MDELDAAYSARLDAQAEAERKLARELEVKSVERLAQQHEARERVRVVQEARRAHLAEIEAKWATKWNKSNELSQSRDDAMRSRRSFIGLLATERQAVVNAMQVGHSRLARRVAKRVADAALRTSLRGCRRAASAMRAAASRPRLDVAAPRSPCHRPLR
jgi:hypothetical protein